MSATPATVSKPSQKPNLLTPLPELHLLNFQGAMTFEGPLDVLLHLVRAGQMDVFDLPIVTLCDQYMAFLRSQEERDLHVAGEFFVMAATLLEIKSRLLLPKPPKEDNGDEVDENGLSADDPRAELVQKLLEYGRFQSIAQDLQGREGDRQLLFFRAPTPLTGEYRLPPKFGEMSAQALLDMLQKMLAEVGAGERAVTSIRKQKMTLRMTMRSVLTRVEAAGPEGINIIGLFPEPPFERFELVLLFLALLELLRQSMIIVAQEEFCGDIVLFFVPENMRDGLWGLTEDQIEEMAREGEKDG
jgi:segregation and condensation protein A